MGRYWTVRALILRPVSRSSRDRRSRRARSSSAFASHKSNLEDCTMTHRLTKLVAVTLGLIMLGGVTTSSYAQEENGCNHHHTRNGAVIGGVVGGLLGHFAGGRRGNGASTVLGAIAGAALGG